MIKTLSKLGIEGKCLNITKATYEKPTANIIHSNEKLKRFSSKIRNKERMPTHTSYIQHNTGIPSQNTQARKRKASKWEREVKLSLFSDDIILCVGNPKDFTEQYG